MTVVILGGLGPNVNIEGEGGVGFSDFLPNTRRRGNAHFRENEKSSAAEARGGFDTFYGCLNCGERDGRTRLGAIFCHDCREVDHV